MSDRNSDLAEIGAVIDEMYTMISGPKGPRDWSRQMLCFHPKSRQIRTWVDEAGQPDMKLMDPAEYAADTMAFFAANDFYELETHRRIDLFGNMAHAWSYYEARRSLDDDDFERRGINSIQLYRDPKLGWRIISMIWDNERGGLERPAIER